MRHPREASNPGAVNYKGKGGGDPAPAGSPPRRVFRCRCQKRGAYIHDNVCATRVIVSKDEDFLYLASRAESFAPLLWVRLGNCRTSALIEAFDRLWPRIEQALVSGEGVVEVR